MRVKSSSHVVEEMTSLSRIIRSYNNVPVEKKAHIPIRTFEQEKVEDEEIVKSIDMHAQREAIQQERENMLRKVEIEMSEIRSQTEHMRQVALDDIHTMRQAWNEEKVELEKQAYEEGYTAGYNQGVEEAHAAWKEKLEEANRIVERAAEDGIKYREEQEFVILHMAMQAAERILNITLDRDEEVYIEVVKRALKEAREMKEIKLYVSPKYYEVVSRSRDELVEIFPPDIPFLIFANDDFEDEECYIETNHGRIVVTIDEQLKVLKEQLIEILESGD